MLVVAPVAALSVVLGRCLQVQFQAVPMSDGIEPAPWLAKRKPQLPIERHRALEVVDEELLIVKEGTLETFQSGATRRVGPGGIIFQASNELHNVTNVGTSPATYFVIGWTIPGGK